MKKVFLLSLAMILGLAVVAQNVHMKSGIRSESFTVGQKIGVEPVKSGTQVSPLPRPSVKNNGDNPNVVNIITIGQSANGYGYGYWGGQKTMVWADDALKCVINLHRMGPGTTPPSLSGYLGIDLGVNLAQQASDWSNDKQIYGAFLNTGGTYYLDAARYPRAAFTRLREQPRSTMHTRFTLPLTFPTTGTGAVTAMAAPTWAISPTQQNTCTGMLPRCLLIFLTDSRSPRTELHLPAISNRSGTERPL